jgi:hypothetical protein
MQRGKTRWEGNCWLLRGWVCVASICFEALVEETPESSTLM